MQARLSGWISNWLLQGNLKWQFLPAPLRVYSAGLNFNNFDEFAGGLTLRNLNLEDMALSYGVLLSTAGAGNFTVNNLLGDLTNAATGAVSVTLDDDDGELATLIG